jgi:hypothetical protein
MAILFFEGFNLQNSDTTPYLDSAYWTRPIDANTPRIAYSSFGTDQTDTQRHLTHGALNISGYRLDTNPQEQSTFIQLSGVSGLNSNEIYLSFRVGGLSHNYLSNTTFPYATKLFTLCSGNNESLVFETVRTSGATIQGGDAQWYHAQSGLGISVKQSGTELGLFDLRLGDLTSYVIFDPRLIYFTNSRPNAPLTIVTSYGSSDQRYIHLEFLINRTGQIVNCKVDGLDILNRLTTPPYNNNASGSYSFGDLDNIKFYNRGISGSPDSIFGLNNGAITIDDLAICNNSGNSPNIWMGPKTRIYLLNNNLYNEQNIIGKQDWTLGAGSYNTAIDTRNGDTSYLSSETSGNIFAAPLVSPGSESYFSNFSSFFQNGIGGIRLYNDVRKTFLDTNFVNVYATGTGVNTSSSAYYNIGPSHTVNNTSYNIKNSFIFNDPATNAPWTSGTFFIKNNNSNYYQTSGYFGIKKI